jgi:hypothetical protein
MSTSQCRFDGCIVFTAHRCLGTLFCCTSSRNINRLSKLCGVGKNRDVVWSNFYEASMHSNVLHFAIYEIDTCVALGKRTKKCNVPWQERNIATLKSASNDLLSLARKQHALRRYQFYAKGTS